MLIGRLRHRRVNVLVNFFFAEGKGRRWGLIAAVSITSGEDLSGVCHSSRSVCQMRFEGRRMSQGREHECDFFNVSYRIKRTSAFAFLRRIFFDALEILNQKYHYNAKVVARRGSVSLLSVTCVIKKNMRFV